MRRLLSKIRWPPRTLMLIDPLTRKYRDFDFENGFTFDHTLTARVTLERRAKVSATCHQDTKLYNITGRSCVGCSQIAAMKGNAHRDRNRPVARAAGKWSPTIGIRTPEFSIAPAPTGCH